MVKLGDIRNDYFDWMCGLVCRNEYEKDNYSYLFEYLDGIEFTWIVDMDVNRANDGINLRYIYAYETSQPNELIDRAIGDRPCSLLEMMVALAFRCENSIMQDDDIGDRTGLWFWTMVESLNLDYMNNNNFDIDIADSVISKLLDRRYSKNGKGGLFTLKRPPQDMRTAEIWYQMMWYLDENYDFTI